jgi:hypothetical protein
MGITNSYALSATERHAHTEHPHHTKQNEESEKYFYRPDSDKSEATWIGVLLKWSGIFRNVIHRNLCRGQPPPMNPLRKMRLCSRCDVIKLFRSIEQIVFILSSRTKSLNVTGK